MGLSILADRAGSDLQNYKRGLKITKDIFNLIPVQDLASPEISGYHTLLSKQTIPDMRGVCFDKNISLYKSAGLSEIMTAEKIFFDYASEEVIVSPNPDICSNLHFRHYCSMFYPLFVTGNTKSNPLSRVTERIKSCGDGMSVNKVRCVGKQEKEGVVTKYLPKCDASLDVLTPDDLLPIFHDPKRKMFMLCLGRMIAGSPGELFDHYYRSFCLIKGEPKTGKTSLVSLVTRTIEKLGFTTSTFSKLNVDFGLHEIATADLAYSDDLNTEQLKRIIEAPNFKQIVSGSKIRSSVKFMSDVEVQSSAVFLANINRFDPACLYNTDDGVLNRLAVLELKTLDDIKNHLFSEDSASFGSTDVRPHSHYSFLAKKLGVSVDAIVVRLLNLSFEYFRSVCEAEALEQTVETLKTRLQYKIYQDMGKPLASLLQISYALKTGAGKIKDLTPLSLCESFIALNAVMNDLRLKPLGDKLKSSWVDQGRPDSHPWIIFTELDNLSVAAAATVANNIVMGGQMSGQLVPVIKVLFSELVMRNGIKVPAFVSGIQANHREASKSTQTKSLIADLSQSSEALALLQSPEFYAEVEYLYSIDYDRQTVYDALNNTLNFVN